MFPKKNRRKIVVNNITFYYKNIGSTISSIVNQGTGEVIKCSAEWKSSDHVSTDITPKDVELIIRKHYNWQK